MPTRKKRESTSLSLFEDSSQYVERNKKRLQAWEAKGIRFGTSSWKYEGWKSQVYNRAYSSKKAFQQECLAEYSTLFPTVSGDFTLYDFPKVAQMQDMHAATADNFKISLKVTERITILEYPNMPRYGSNAGNTNPDFLNVHLFEDAFLVAFDELKEKRGAIIFEFSTFHPASEMSCEKFIDRMGAFIAQLPAGYEYAVEIRNREWLKAEYLDMLRLHGAAHVLNNWTRMPPIAEQIQIPGILTAPFVVARCLLVPGTTYEQAVDAYAPYDKIKAENPEARIGVAESVLRCIEQKKTFYGYINNRVEGNAPQTIEGVLDALDKSQSRTGTGG